MLVLWLLALISLVVLSGAQERHIEIKLTRNYLESRQCYRLAEGGFYYALGKLIQAKKIEQLGVSAETWDGEERPVIWTGDGRPHVLELPEGTVEVRVMDEGGKMNVNRASQEALARLFSVLGCKPEAAQRLVVAILDWRDADSLIRVEGAESSYYLERSPPYVAHNGPLDVAEEIFWVRGFDHERFSRLGQFITVEDVGAGINVNTAPAEVLEAIGFSPEQAKSLIQARIQRPFINLDELTEFSGGLPFENLLAQITFNSSPFFTIIATGRVNVSGSESRHTIKALVRIRVDRATPWDILSWADDFPG